MSRLSCIQSLKDGPAMSALDQSIETIRDHMEKWGRSMPVEERTYTHVILGNLIDLQVRSVTDAVRLGETMNRRLIAERQAETQDMEIAA